jgi:cytoskeletal protein CcmA (bactofilin family)
MKHFGKLLTLFVLLVLVLVPLQSAQARGLGDQQSGGQVLFGTNFTLKSGETLNGDLVVFGGSVITEKDSTVKGALVVFGGSLLIDGEVTGDVVLIGGAVKLGDNAHVRGSLVTIGGTIDRAKNARVDGDTINNPQPPVTIQPGTQPQIPSVAPEISRAFDPFWQAAKLLGQALALALLAALIILFLPEHTARIGQAASMQPIIAGSFGLLTVILFPLTLVIMIVTLILIPVAALAVIVLTVAVLFGWVALGTEVGVRLVRMLNQSWPLPISAMLGTFLMTIVVDGIGFVPCVGWVAPFLVALVGLGAVLMTRFGTRIYLMQNPAPAPIVPPASSADETQAQNQSQ